MERENFRAAGDDDESAPSRLMNRKRCCEKKAERGASLYDYTLPGKELTCAFASVKQRVKKRCEGFVSGRVHPTRSPGALLALFSVDLFRSPLRGLSGTDGA